MPPELLSQAACQDIIAQYGQSFRDVIQFENIPNSPESHQMFNQMLTNIRKRHQASIAKLCKLHISVVKKTRFVLTLINLCIDNAMNFK